ncbi:MAG: hypothetical protein KAH01_05225, partial [Caldisericia bacterium]|nr:hypothetical protein [Caldisericia bacterium]
CSWSDLQMGRMQSYFGDKHKIAEEQLYKNNPFLKNLNKNESYGMHLNSNIEYGNIYSYSPMPGFFSGDVVVSSASAHLNGVSTYRLVNHTHSSTFASLGTPITQSQKVFKKIQYWLTHSIRRTPLRNMHIHVSRAEGEVYVKRLNGITKHGIPETLIDIKKKPIQSMAVKSMDYIGTHHGKAMVSLYMNDIPWGYIHLDADTELRLGYVSPHCIEVKLLFGKARFTTFELNGNGHYSVEIKQNEGYWQNVIGLNTDYIVERCKDTLYVYSIKGDVMLNIDKNIDKISSQIVKSKNGLEVNGEGDIIGYTPHESSWWNDTFYEVKTNGWIKSYFSDLWSDTQYQFPLIWTYATNLLWNSITRRGSSVAYCHGANFPPDDIMKHKVGVASFGLAMLAFLFLSIAIAFRKGSVLLWIPITILLTFLWYTLSQYGITTFI